MLTEVTERFIPLKNGLFPEPQRRRLWLIAGDGMRLAGDAANDCIHMSTPASAVEGAGIAPHRSRSQPAFFHRVDQVRDGECFPLDTHDRASVWNRQFSGEVQSSGII